jgi:transposase
MKAHTQQTRLEAIRLYAEENKSLSWIREELNISYTSLRSWIKRYKSKGEQGLLPNYSACGRSREFSQEVVQRAVDYKKEHEDWGAPFILLKLEDDFARQPLPSVRRLQQIFQQLELQPKKDNLPKGDGKWAKHAFDRVQVDAKERLKTADGQDCCYLNFTDEYTGSVLDAFLFPLFPH